MPGLTSTDCYVGWLAVNITLLSTATLVRSILYLQLKICDIKINVETNDLKEQVHNFLN